jgi:L-fuconolactonase
MIDAHTHFWDPSVLRYPWLDEEPALRRAYGIDEYRRDWPETAPPMDRVVFVECDCNPTQSRAEVAYVERLTSAGAPVAAIVAHAEVNDHQGLPPLLDAYASVPLVRGIRHNIQGHPAGFCAAPAFVDGVREIGRRGFTFDLCVTHDQLAEAVDLVRRCPETRFVLDHCGKPAIRDRSLEPWWRDLARLAAEPNVVGCKLSGLLTEAGPGWIEPEILPFAEAAVAVFGADRMMYGSDWPVVTLAGNHAGWYDFTRRVTFSWTESARRAFYSDNAARVYRL